ncbi:hypothetical protein ACFOZ0_10785 [Streptomyces yaanensis]|uniref:Secreted protein n=1 Tax=Streptomyces yaanensis TaxID=1142239 RepID=A0ABV7SAE7_9ACTN|nr:hypothetical protein [Streptomyces sp. CGMCC 4.7035]WNB96828.1 hypothetical protein Q2K21_01365 [Streptomyces sp. CGMCC 4.7035]
MAAGIRRHTPRVIGASCLVAALAGTMGVIGVTGVTGVDAAPRTAKAAAAPSKAVSGLRCKVVRDAKTGKLVLVDAVTDKPIPDPRLCRGGAAPPNALGEVTAATAGGRDGATTGGPIGGR